MFLHTTLFKAATATLLLAATTSAMAHGPTRQQAEQSVSINAPAAAVWAVVGDFFGLDKWHPAIKSSEKTSDEVRVLTLQDGNTITESIKDKNDETMVLKYKIEDMSTIETFEFAGREVKRTPLPVANYTGILSVEANGDNASTVTWKGKFYRAWMLNPPTPEGMSDEDAVNTMNGVYKAGLDNLKTMLEK